MIGLFQIPLRLLRIVDCFATGDLMERGCGVGQFSKRRCVPLFRPQGKSRRIELQTDWRMALAFDQELSDTLPNVHRSFEGDRRRILV